MYIDATVLKEYGGVSGAADNALITALITRAQKYIESYTGRTFEASTNTTRRFTIGEDTDGRLLYLDNDLCTIDAIVTNADGASPTTLTASEYITRPRNITPYFAIELLPSGNKSWEYTDDPQMGITVSGKWAYSTSAPDDIKHACVRLVNYFYHQKDSGVYDVTAIPDAGVITVPQGIPRDIKIILDTYKRHL